MFKIVDNKRSDACLATIFLSVIRFERYLHSSKYASRSLKGLSFVPLQRACALQHQNMVTYTTRRVTSSSKTIYASFVPSVYLLFEPKLHTIYFLIVSEQKERRTCITDSPKGRPRIPKIPTSARKVL